MAGSVALGGLAGAGPGAHRAVYRGLRLGTARHHAVYRGLRLGTAWEKRAAAADRSLGAHRAVYRGLRLGTVRRRAVYRGLRFGTARRPLWRQGALLRGFVGGGPLQHWFGLGLPAIILTMAFAASSCWAFLGACR